MRDRGVSSIIAVVIAVIIVIAIAGVSYMYIAGQAGSAIQRAELKSLWIEKFDAKNCIGHAEILNTGTMNAIVRKVYVDSQPTRVFKGANEPFKPGEILELIFSFTCEPKSYTCRIETDKGDIFKNFDVKMDYSKIESGIGYIGYEDLPDPASNDYDYNDFGMFMYYSIFYNESDIAKINLEFDSKLHLAGYNHQIHINVSVANDVSSNVKVMTLDANDNLILSNESDFSGPIDVVVFNTTATEVGFTTYVQIDFDGNIPPDKISKPFWDPYIYIWNTGETYHVNDTPDESRDMSALCSGVGSAKLPWVLVIPIAWNPPAEGATIWCVYGYFDDYYVTDSPEDWYKTYTGPLETYKLT